MRAIATVLYEDQMRAGAAGSYPLHDLVMRFVEDQINGETWKLQKLVFKNARKGIGNVLNDIEDTAFFANSGDLYVLVDRDAFLKDAGIRKRLKLPPNATSQQIAQALRASSNAPAKLHVFFLDQNLEDLLRAVKACDPTLLPTAMATALAKADLNDRDIVLSEVKKAANASLRTCIAKAQPDIAALATALAALIPAKVQPWP